MSGSSIRIGSFTKMPTVLQHYQQQTGAHQSSLSRTKEGNKSGSLSRNPPTSMVLEMQETIPLDEVHLENADAVGNRRDGDLSERTIWQNSGKSQAGAWSKVSEQAKNQS
jgi:hypothetical protein